MFVEAALADTTCPIRRQLLGATTSNAGLFSPHPLHDTPLSAWAAKIGAGTTDNGYDAAATDTNSLCGRMYGDVPHATYPRNEQVKTLAVLHSGHSLLACTLCK